AARRYCARYGNAASKARTGGVTEVNRIARRISSSAGSAGCSRRRSTPGSVPSGRATGESRCQSGSFAAARAQASNPLGLDTALRTREKEREMDRRHFLIGTAGLLGAAAAGCGQKEDEVASNPSPPRRPRPAALPPPAAGGPVTFGVIPKMLDNPVFTLAQR